MVVLFVLQMRMQVKCRSKYTLHVQPPVRVKLKSTVPFVHLSLC